jgi:hypothetical protein
LPEKKRKKKKKKKKKKNLLIIYMADSQPQGPAGNVPPAASYENKNNQPENHESRPENQPAPAEPAILRDDPSIVVVVHLPWERGQN